MNGLLEFIPSLAGISWRALLVTFTTYLSTLSQHSSRIAHDFSSCPWSPGQFGSKPYYPHKAPVFSSLPAFGCPCWAFFPFRAAWKVPIANGFWNWTPPLTPWPCGWSFRCPAYCSFATAGRLKTFDCIGSAGYCSAAQVDWFCSWARCFNFVQFLWVSWFVLSNTSKFPWSYSFNSGVTLSQLRSPSCNSARFQQQTCACHRRPWLPLRAPDSGPWCHSEPWVGWPYQPRPASSGPPWAPASPRAPQSPSWLLRRCRRCFSVSFRGLIRRFPTCCPPAEPVRRSGAAGPTSFISQYAGPVVAICSPICLVFSLCSSGQTFSL